MHVNNLAERDYFPTCSTLKATLELRMCTIFLKRILTRFLESSDLEWDELLLFTYNCYRSGHSSECYWYHVTQYYLPHGWVVSD